MTHSERVTQAQQEFPGISYYTAEMIAFDRDAEEDGIYTELF